MQVLSGLALFFISMAVTSEPFDVFIAPFCKPFIPFRVSVLFNVYSRLLGHVPPLAYYRLLSWVTSDLDSLCSSEYDTRFSIVNGETG